MIFQYKGFHGCASRCEIETYRHPHFTVVLCSERDDNPGTSVTNFAEGLATQVCAEHKIDTATLVWIEHYPKRGDVVRFDESFDLVTFTRNGDTFKTPKWRPITRDEAQAIIDGKPPEDYAHREPSDKSPPLIPWGWE